MERHIDSLKSAYQERRDLMLAMLEECFPDGVSWTHPEGGMFVWVRLPDHYNAMEILKLAIEKGVAFVPGEPFFTDGSGLNTFRLNFSNASLELIEEGMRRLAGVLSEVWTGKEV
jgi:DNA-binding transcriptional MocR family regulator